MRRLAQVAAVALGTLLGFAGVSAAFGTNHIGAGIGTQANVDGVDAAVTGLTWNPQVNQCVTYIVVMRDYTSNVQNEAGLPICRSGATFDGTCPSHYGMAETFDSTTYVCNSGNYFTVGVAYPVSVERASPSPTGTVSFAAGATNTGYGFYSGDQIQGVGTPESTEPSGTGCPSTPHAGQYRRFKRLNGGTYTLITGQAYSGSIPSGLPVCWSFNTVATGDFNVS
jgi:hypothetical protein